MRKRPAARAPAPCRKVGKQTVIEFAFEGFRSAEASLLVYRIKSDLLECCYFGSILVICVTHMRGILALTRTVL